MPISILQVKGVGPATAERLAAAGFNSADALAAATPQQLASVPGFGESRARQVIAHARQQVMEASPGGAERQAVDPDGGKTAGAAKSKTGKGSKKKAEKKKTKQDKSKKGKAKKDKSNKDKTKKSGAKKKTKKKRSG
ncbi:MAG: helix-hairpin-helix domain-containing protein [Desulfobacteraceae bacterium]|jgi:NAD-dependent DNA ligase|nr:helix-hairpin-helix domain-containing protein [Desulfobacteraceae bacterium]